VKTIGVLLLLLPIAVIKAGGFAQMKAQLPHDYFSPLSIGGQTVFTYVLIYTFGMLIGQDIWQRVFTARNDKVAKLGGTVAGTYCLAYAVAGAVIGTAAKVLYPHLASADDAFATIVKDALPIGIKGLVLAAALSAVMSTSSGALIACGTVANNDIWSRLRGKVGSTTGGESHDEVKGNRLFILIMGAAMIGIAISLNNVVEALTVAYNLLVGGLLVPILGGLVWRRGTNVGAVAAMAVGTIATLATMFYVGDIYANEQIYVGLASGLVVYLVGSLTSKPTDPEVLAEWDRRSRGQATEPVPTPVS
jgi:SSS family solute:Na+ symporter